MKKQDKILKVAQKLSGLRNAMFVTLHNGEMHSRPMAVQEREFDGDIWFMTSKDSSKVADIKKNPQVLLLFGEGNGVRFVSLSGTGELVHDKAMIHQFWNELDKAWFTGEDDPSIQLIKVKVTFAEYWDYKGGKLGAFFDMAKSAITHHMAEGGENETFEF